MRCLLNGMKLIKLPQNIKAISVRHTAVDVTVDVTDAGVTREDQFGF